ncbi:ABC transporter permease [candidate division KSB1 bacterium]|nr:ABC transporter permease [candidate division KSB1 bacterium]
MFNIHLKIALRNLLRHKGYSFINMAGLAVGMVCCILIGLYVEDELSFDCFHENVDRLFVITGEHPVPGRTLATPYSLASTLQAAMPEIEQTTRVWEGKALPVIREEVQLRANRRVLLTEATFFEMFSFPALAGDPAATLNAPDAAVITESMARTFFGEEYPIGRTLTFHRFGNNVHTIRIGAVVKDAPANSSLQFDLVAPLSLLGEKTLQENQWGVHIVATYVQARSPLPVKMFSARITETLQKHLPALALEGFTYSALRLPALHLSGLNAEGLQGQPQYLYLFGTVALFVLVIAAVNYVNLVTAQSMQRAREVGVRKTMGAERSQLVRQFLGESILLSLGALVLAFVLMDLALTMFNRLFDKELTFMGIGYGMALPLLCGFVLLVAIAAGAYPAFVLSRFQPTEVLRGTGKVGASGGRRLRQSLVVFQFTISAALIIGTTIIYRQLNYMQHKNLGFSGEQVVVIDLPASLSATIRETLKQRVLSYSGILRASVATGVPSRFQMGFRRAVAEAAPQASTHEERIRFMPAAVDYDFIPTLGLSLLAGRNFSDRFQTDISRAYVLNKTAVERLGWSPKEAIGKTFTLGPPGTPEGEVIGVVDNFHIASLHKEIEPVVLQFHTLPPVGSLPYVLAAKLAPEHIREGMEHIEQQFSLLAPGASFQYVFLDDVFNQMYRAEERLSRIFTTFAALAIFIACLGLFGLAAFTAERRTKEIGIRKVLGASVSRIVTLLSKDFAKLVLLANLIAWPIAWYAMNRWLQDFAYRVHLSWWVFALAGGLALLIALLTVSTQAIRAALANPVEALRYE